MPSTEHSASLNTRPTTPTGGFEPAYDLICIGFGPAQIATAIANRESRKPSKVLFLEKKSSFSWHPPAHLPRSRMGNAFVYDLATTRNPRSAFSYASYLFAQDRLIAFANSDQLQPLREEFDDYLRWCAEQFAEQVRYGNEVVSVAPERDEDAVRGWSVAVRDINGVTQVLQTKNIVAPSPKRRGPKVQLLTNVNFEAGQRIVSFDDYLSKRNGLREPQEPRLDIAVVGSGQQAVEILGDLLTCPALGNITAITESGSLAPLKVLSGESASPSRLCSLWARPECHAQPTVDDATELVQSIYGRAYEKQVASNGQYTLRIMADKDAAQVLSQAGIIIAENAVGGPLAGSDLFHELDVLVLGCRQKGESLEEVQFKRGAVAKDCRMWMLGAHSDGGRSLAKDVAERAGDMVRALAADARETRREGNGAVVINARM